jgi:hypothetical protein
MYMGWDNSVRLQGNGDVKHVKRQVPGFNRIDYTGIGAVFVHFGDECHVELTTDSNIEPYILTDVRDDTLYINIKPGISVNNITELRFDVCTRNIEGVVHTGVGDITITNAETDTLSINFSGTGACTVTGKGTHFAVRMKGVGKVDGKDFAVKTAEVDHSGVGTVTVWALDLLDAAFSGVGNIVYRGDPKVSSRGKGIGELRRSAG